ncbi:phosphogluconate dehydrogenase (NAD(+)-dependent, decarboxylating) [Nocardia sp. NPDC059239]|uniref:phosphogluconate dehydrogenase (NAD(+)-dependent, decarboxylating) n=1 Tax=Nocardia sp. NPDC059239 TaxID=3346785 RepID=UPI0036CE612E
MKIGMVGAGRMGVGLLRRLVKKGHEGIVYDSDPEATARLNTDGIPVALSLEELVNSLSKPRVVWVMVPAAATGGVIEKLTPLLAPGDTVVDGGNTFYRDDVARSKELARQGIHYVDVGTSGGVYGAERGFCLMIGGEKTAVERLDPLFAALAPGAHAAQRTEGRTGPLGREEHGYVHCGPAGAGHFVKMVHNGVEYGQMAALAEGMAILAHANVGTVERVLDAETAPLAGAEFYTYEIAVDAVMEAWRRGSVVSSWLVDLTAAALHGDPELSEFSGRVADSGEGRWALQAAIDEGVPAHVLSAALLERFASRGNGDYGFKALSAMRRAFGGHIEKTVTS